MIRFRRRGGTIPEPRDEIGFYVALYGPRRVFVNEHGTPRIKVIPGADPDRLVWMGDDQRWRDAESAVLADLPSRPGGLVPAGHPHRGGDDERRRLGASYADLEGPGRHLLADVELVCHQPGSGPPPGTPRH